MSEEIRLDGLGLAPGVLETIVTLAAKGVEGVACVCGQGLAGLAQKAVGKSGGRTPKPVDIQVEDGSVSVALHVEFDYGKPLRAVAVAVQEAVADAVRSQVGVPVRAVNVFVDGIVFKG
ncbi:MAG: Asp23/Gls24 family envelope stress response protein [Coriobacteriia bacterium]|nr:Asp23/Gls24 family envelope stress response protein [Coriobacteriia bacterium]